MLAIAKRRSVLGVGVNFGLANSAAFSDCEKFLAGRRLYLKRVDST